MEDPAYDATVERVFLFQVEVMDGNCPQHIRPRYTEQELQARIGEPESEVRDCCPE